MIKSIASLNVKEYSPLLFVTVEISAKAFSASANKNSSLWENVINFVSAF